MAVSVLSCMFDSFRFQVLHSLALSCPWSYSTILETQAVLDNFKKEYKLSTLQTVEGCKESWDGGGAAASHSKLNPSPISIYDK